MRREFHLSPCTLRAAIQEANATKGADTINFNIPANATKTISPSFGLDAITHPVVIDGYSQPGAQPNALADGNDAVLKIELSGASAGVGENGLTIRAANSTVKGLIINHWSDQGVGILGSGNKVEGNFIGTDASGTAALGNSGGVFIFDAPNNTIGGTTAGARNLISGNDNQGVNIGGAGATGNKVMGNYIGTNAAGTAALGNSVNGVLLGAVHNTIGGTVAGARNLISGNTQAGVVVDSPAAKGNRILSNSIFSNGGLGIDLGDDGVTDNDSKDLDTGPNTLQNYPQLSSAVTNPDGTTTITGNLPSRPRRTFTIQFFSSLSADPSGHGEGKTFLGQKKVKTTRQGITHFFSLTATLPAGEDVITTTATRSGGTSEFSAPAP